MNALVAHDRRVYVVIAILTFEYRYEGLIEGHIEDPVHEKDHVAEETDYVLCVVFAVLEEVVHV